MHKNFKRDTNYEKVNDKTHLNKLSDSSHSSESLKSEAGETSPAKSSPRNIIVAKKRSSLIMPGEKFKNRLVNQLQKMDVTEGVMRHLIPKD